ncbi:class I SAM-dependent methyltransferase [soil metagenome]
MIERWTEGNAEANMPEDLLVELSAIIHRHPWNRARARLTLAVLDRWEVHPPARVRDAGCGWGVTLERLERKGYQAEGLDISRKALERIDRPGRRLIEADLTRPLPRGNGEYDAVLALDVIEHLDDDRAAVERLGQLTKPGGIVVVSVPALPDLFGEFDRVQGHRRRYLPETLRGAFEGTVLRLERLSWWGAWMVPLLRRQRRYSRAQQGESPLKTFGRYLKLPPRPIPWAFDLAYALEHQPALSGRLRTGTSLLAVARRADGP